MCLLAFAIAVWKPLSIRWGTGMKYGLSQSVVLHNAQHKSLESRLPQCAQAFVAMGTECSTVTAPVFSILICGTGRSMTSLRPGTWSHSFATISAFTVSFSRSVPKIEGWGFQSSIFIRMIRTDQILPIVQGCSGSRSGIYNVYMIEFIMIQHCFVVCRKQFREWSRCDWKDEGPSSIRPVQYSVRRSNNSM
jgi:hypothetical protein